MSNKNTANTPPKRDLRRDSLGRNMWDRLDDVNLPPLKEGNPANPLASGPKTTGGFVPDLPRRPFDFLRALSFRKR